MKRSVVIAAGAAIVLALAVLIGVFSSLDSIVKTAVETYGSEMTQTSVRLGRAGFQLTEGKGALYGLVIGNPAGYKTDYAMRLGEISLDLDEETVMEDTIVITELVINAPVITYEFGATGSNIDEIQRNLAAYTGSLNDASASESDEPGKKLIIENLYVRDGQVNVSAKLLQGQALPVPLPTIHMKNVGKSKGGASPAEIGKQLLGRILGDVKGSVAKANLSGALQGIGETGKQLGDGVKGVGESLKNVFK